MSIIRSNPINLKGETVLDVRVSSLLSRELAAEIIESVGHSQLFVQTTLPDVLLVTQKQFASLQDHTEEMTHTTDRMFITPYNIMEVRIDREVDTIQAVEDAIVDTENLEAQQKEDSDATTDKSA